MEFVGPAARVAEAEPGFIIKYGMRPVRMVPVLERAVAAAMIKIQSGALVLISFTISSCY